VAGALDPQAVVDAADALYGWIEGRWPGATWKREWPLAHRLPDGSQVRGAADLVVNAGAGHVVIDHKAFAGPQERMIERASAAAPQLAAYGAALAAATGLPTLGLWIHLPLAALAVPVEPTA